MNPRPFHRVRWVLAQVVIISALIGSLVSVIYFVFLVALWLSGFFS